MPRRSISRGRSSMIFLHAYGSTRFAAPTCTAFAPAIIISMTSCALLTPPMPMTGMLTALIMFFVGTGPVRGFAVTTAIGIVTSMFTAVYVTRAIIAIYIGWRHPKTITV